jgi:hypothetical protein
MTNVQEQRMPTLDLAAPLTTAQPGLGSAPAAAAWRGGGDRVLPLRRNADVPQLGGGLQQQDGFAPVDGTSPLGGILSQLMNVISELCGMLGGGLGGFFGQPGISAGAQTYFGTANGSSTGDPHLAFSGTTASGQNEYAHYDNMNGDPDLLDSGSFAGGYQISTQATAPNASGVTYNQSATVTTNAGATQVCLDDDGHATVEQYGQTFSLTDGQTLALGNGESVTRNGDGSLTVTDQNGNGGSITTTMRENGNGVNVSAQAQNVALGGDLVNNAALAPQPSTPIVDPLPVREPSPPQW